MSEFKVCKTTIVGIAPHENAHSLDLVTVYGFTVVSRKDFYIVGSKCFYVPIDSVLPQDLEDILFPEDSKIKLHHHRVRQIRIRSYPSQGMLVSEEDIIHLLKLRGKKIPDFKEEVDYAKIIGIEKYEPPAPSFQGNAAKTVAYSNKFFGKYNGIDNVKWKPTAFDGEEVVIQEKLHGCLRNYETIELVDGTKKTIQEIVDNKLEVSVWGYDVILKKLVPSKILGWANHGKSRDWLKIKYTKLGTPNGAPYRTLEVTPNHKFFLPILVIT